VGSLSALGIASHLVILLSLSLSITILFVIVHQSNTITILYLHFYYFSVFTSLIESEPIILCLHFNVQITQLLLYYIIVLLS
jgi:hypothetical protein